MRILTTVESMYGREYPGSDRWECTCGRVHIGLGPHRNRPVLVLCRTWTRVLTAVGVTVTEIRGEG